MKTSFSVLVSTGLVFILFLSPGYAENLGIYVGAGIGATEIENDVVPLKQVLEDRVRFDERQVGYKLFTGYQFNDYISLEAILADFGELEITGNSGNQMTSGGKLWTFTQNGTEITAHIRTVALGVKFTLPFSTFTKRKYLSRISPFFIAGGHFWDLDMDSSPMNGTDQSSSIADDNGLDFFYGAGLQYQITPAVGIRLEYSFFNYQKIILEDTDFISASISYSF